MRRKNSFKSQMQYVTGMSIHRNAVMWVFIMCYILIQTWSSLAEQSMASQDVKEYATYLTNTFVTSVSIFIEKYVSI